MPMDYDDNELQGQNRLLTEEGCSKVSPVLHTYALPKYDFDDSLNRHLTFNSLSENDVFLGITNQEDNQWIEQYSRENSEIDFNSNTIESRHNNNNVWSEATSSESVEMLLKSVGQEEQVVKETLIENLDNCNEPGSLIEVMDPNLNQESEHNQHNTSNLEEKVENTFENVVQKEPDNLVNESIVENSGLTENAGASIEESKIQESPQPVSVDTGGTPDKSIKGGEHSINVESYTYNMEKSLSFVPNVESLESPLVKTSSPVSENRTQKSKSEDHDSPESNVGPVQNSSVEEIENVIKKDVEPSLLVSNCESVVPEQVAVTESDKKSSPDTSATTETNDQPKSPIFGVSLVHQEKTETGFLSSQNEILQSENVVTENPISLTEKEAYPNLNEKVVHVKSCNESQIEEKSQTKNGGQETVNNSQIQDSKESVIQVNKSNDHQTFIDLTQPSESYAEDTTNDVINTNSLPSKIIADVANKIQPVSSGKATQEEKNFTFEVSKSGVLGQAGKSFQSYPTFQVSNLPKVIEGPSKDSSTIQLDSKKMHEVSVSPHGLTLTGVKPKPERKPRRKSDAKKSKQLKEITPARDLIRGEISAVLLTPPSTGQVARFETGKAHENATKPAGFVLSPKLPDLNNSTSMYQQPFTDNQQVQLRAQILVYGSLISGSPPEEPHMIAAFGQSDGGRIWEGVWCACLERLQAQKSQPKPNTPIQQRSDLKNAGNKPDLGIKHQFLQNTIPSSPTPPNITPMIPLSSPLWNISTPKTARFDYNQPFSPLHPYQTQPVHKFSGLNPSWLSQGPFSGQWLASSPIPTFNPTPRLPGPTNESIKLTPVKESNPTVDNSSSDSKSRKRKKGTQNVEKVGISEESLTKVEESKVQADEANKHADNAVSQCNGVWSQLEKRLNLGLSSDDESKLVSSAVSIAAAASVAKVAAAAAKIASDVADQAKSMVNSFLSSKSQNVDQMNNRFDKATTDAIFKAAELAAEAVSQAGKIVGMSEPMNLKDLVEAGPEGYWKKKNVEYTPQVSGKGKLVTKSGASGKGYFGNLAENQKTDKRKFKSRVGKGPESEIGPIGTSIVGQSQTESKVSSSISNESDIKEGCLVEVYKDNDKHKGAWFGANVSSIKDGKALVSYTEIQSDEGKLEEWVPLEVDGNKLPKIRVAHPMTTMRFEGNRKRRRTASTDFVWSSGDRVDVWIQDRWREAIVKETNKIDLTSLTVQFPDEGETLVTRSWFVRPTLIWKDDKWIQCHTSDKHLSSQGDLPQEKRLKLGNPTVDSNINDESSESVDHPRKQQELKTLSLSAHESVFNIGSSKDNKKVATNKTGLGPRVVFGVPKPGKKQKFMEVSKHYVADVSNNNSIKFTKYLIPQAPGARGWRNNSKTDPKQAPETKSKLVKPRKPPIPTFSKSTTRESGLINKTIPKEIDLVSSLGVSVTTKSERSKKRKFRPTGGKVGEVETPAVEPRRSNRKIQPTSRLLEGLQSSMTISKMPAASQTKVTPKGDTNNG